MPEIFKLVRGLHFRARLRAAELGDGAVDEVDLVVEVDDCGAVRCGASDSVRRMAAHH